MSTLETGLKQKIKSRFPLRQKRKYNKSEQLHFQENNKENPSFYSGIVDPNVVSNQQHQWSNFQR